MKLICDINVENDIKFKKMRKTATKTCIIDIEENAYQTGWLKIITDVENYVCVNTNNIQSILNDIDNKILCYSSNIFEFSIDEMKNMYRPLYKSSCYLVVPLNSKTILFNNGNFYNKDKIKDVLKIDDDIRMIISFKKITFKDYELSVNIELSQIEL